MGKPKHTPNDIYIQGDTARLVLTDRAGCPVAVTLLDTVDVPMVRSFHHRWCARWDEHVQNYYVICSFVGNDGKQRTLSLHRFLLQPSPEVQVVHKNHNTLDNRRQNLRHCTPSENRRNPRPGAYVGNRRKARTDKPHAVRRYVWWAKEKKCWRGYVLHGGARHYIGTYATRDAAEVRALEIQTSLEQQEIA